MNHSTAAFLLLAFCCGTAAGQAVTRTPGETGRASGAGPYGRAAAPERDDKGEFDRERETDSQREARAQAERRVGIRFKTLTEDERPVLAPPPEEAARFVAFLNQQDTGLVRLMARDRPDPRVTTRGGGAYYSFAHLVHQYDYGSDLGLEQGRFTAVSAGADFSFLFDLGEINLEEVTTETGPAKFLASYAPPARTSEARKIQLRFHDGYQEGWFVYRPRVPAVVGHTYALRSISYDRSDLLVAFQALRKDEDGSMVLLWKILKRFPATRLERDDLRPAETQ